MANVNIKVGYTIDKTGLNEIKKQLSDIRAEAKNADTFGKMTPELKEASNAAAQLEKILNSAWNSKLNQLDLNKVNIGVKNTYGNVEKLKTIFVQSGQAGTIAYNNFAKSVLETNLQLKQTSSILDKMAVTFKNTVRFGISSSIFNNLTSNIQKAYDYTVKLDTSLNDIRIVTGKSADEMDRFAIKANKVAKDLGRSTKDFTDASLIYYQQGLGNEEAQARAEVTMKAANVTGQSGREVSEQLTAVWNGYKVTAEEAELYVDKLAAVAAGTAADLEELSTGMSKVASAANLMGVDIDQLNAQLATIVSVTRQAPESVGVALKTIYARMSDIQSGLDDETTLGHYTEKMAEYGVNVLDANNQLRDMGDVIEEIGEKWTTMSREQQIALSQTMAGTRQYNNLLSLFDNWDMYTDSLKMSANAAGTLQKQQDIYMESTVAHLQKLRTETERTYDILFDQDAVNGMSDAMTGLLSIFNEWMAGVGGGLRSLTVLASGLANIFSKQIGASISTMIQNSQANKNNLSAEELKQQIVNLYASEGVTADSNSVNVTEQAKIAQRILDIKTALTQKEYNQLTALQKQIGEDAERIKYLEEYKKIGLEILDNENATIEDYEERLSIERESLKNEEKKLSYLTREKNLYQKGLRDEEDTEAFRQSLSDLGQKDTTSMEQFKIIEAARMKIIDGETLSQKEIETIIEAQNQALKEQQQIVERVNQGLEGRQAAENNTLEQLQNKQTQQQSQFDNVEAQKQRQIAIQKTIQGVTTLISLFTTLTGVIETINDESLDGWEKFKRISITLLATLPMLITNFSSMISLMPNLAISMGAVAAGTTAADLGFKQATISVLTFQTALGPLWLVLLAIAAAIGAVVAICVALDKAYNADANAAKAAAEASREAAKAAEDAADAYKKLKDTFKSYDEGVEALQKLTRGTEEYNEALKTVNDTAMDLIKNNQELARHASRNSEGLIVFDEDTAALVEAARSKMHTAQATTDIAQIYANQTSLKSQRTNLARQKDIGYHETVQTEDGTQVVWMQIDDESLQRVIEVINKNNGTLLKEDLEKIESINKNEELMNSIMNASDDIIKLADVTDQLNATNKMLLDESLREKLEEKSSYAGKTEAEKNAIATIYGKGLTQEQMDRLRKEAEEQWDKDAAFGLGNEDEVHAKYAELMNYKVVKDHLGDTADYVNLQTGEEIKKYADDAAREYIKNRQIADKLAEYNVADLDKTISAVEKISELGNSIDEALSSELFGFLTKEDLTFDPTQTTNAMMKELQAKVDSGEFKEILAGITEDEWKAVGYADADSYIKALQEGIQKYDWNAGRSSSLQRLGGVKQNASDLKLGLQTGDITSENILEDDNYKALMGQLKEVKDMYPEVTSSVEVLNKTWLIGTQEYIEALEKVQDKLYQAEIESLTNNANEKIKDLYKEVDKDEGVYGPHRLVYELDLDDEEFQSKMDEVLNAEYAIDVAIHTEAEDEFDSIVAAMDDITEKASLIGEKFIVSANDVRELNNTFPGIVQNMKDLGNGTVQLNKDIVQSAISMAQAEVAADSQATIQKLQNQARLLREKQTIYQEMANAALILAQGETESEETAADARAQISENLSKLKGINDELQTQQEMDNDKAAADASYDNGQITAKNWASAYQSAASSSYKFATVAVANNRAAAGNGEPVAPGDFGTNYSGSTGTSSEAKVLEGTQSALDTPDTSSQKWASLAQKYQMLADSSGKAANDIEGMMAQIGASNIEIADKLGNIRSGKGANPGKKGGSEKEPDYMEGLKDEKDIYHDINIVLSQISTELDKLDKQRKKLFGQDLIDNLNKQLGFLNKQIDATGEKINIARGEASLLKTQLLAAGVSFNPDGTISNYAQVYNSQLNYVNSLIAQYDNMSAEAQEGFKDTVEQAKKDFDTFAKNIDRYDEIITDMIPDLEADIQAATDKKIDLQIEKFDMEIEIRLDLAEAERDWNDFKKKIIDEIEDDDILGNAMARLVDFSSYYKDDNTGIVQALRKQVDNTLTELNQMDNGGWSNVYGDNRTAALEDLKKYYEELMENLEDVLELQKEIHESYLDMMDEAQEKFDEQIKSYEMISDLIDHDMQVISLVYGEESYGQLAKYYDKQQQNFNNQLDFQRQQVDFWRAQLDALDEGSDAWENAKEKWQDAVGELNDLIESSIENLQDKYLNAINLIFQNLNNKVTDGLGLDYIEEEWTLINKNADQYLDTINSLYEVQKLESKYLDALDNTDSISAQRQLKKIMDEELADLRERDKLTEYDIERANKKYEITLKQIALQEAQQNKTKMRLRRDSQGNYRYEYTADGDQIGQLQDELNDMYNSLYNFDKSRYQDNLNQMYEVWVEFQEKMAEAAQINDPVARSERELLLQNQYEQLINGLTEQNTTVRENLHESAFDDLSRLYDVDVSNFQNMSDQEKEVLMGDLIPYWESGVQHMTEVFAGEDGFLGVCRDAFDQLHDATKDYEDGLDELENTGRIDFESIGEGIDQNIERTQQLITDNNELINSYEQELSAINNVIGELDNLVDKYNAAKDAAIAATKAAYEYWSEQQRQAADAANKQNAKSSASSSSSSDNNSNSGSNGSGDSGSRGDGNLVVGDTATFNGQYYYDSYGTKPIGSKYAGVADGIVIDRVTNNPYGIHIHSADGKYKDLGWIKKSQLSGYDTGGYTGTWGNDGRLALLHQKELVLNKEDTANMLDAVNIIRNITGLLGNSVLGKLAAATAGNFGANVGNDVLEQNVHIDAQFPNVKDSREIEEALNNLVNMASMRANKR